MWRASTLLPLTNVYLVRGSQDPQSPTRSLLGIVVRPSPGHGSRPQLAVY